MKNSRHPHPILEVGALAASSFLLVFSAGILLEKWMLPIILIGAASALAIISWAALVFAVTRLLELRAEERLEAQVEAENRERWRHDTELEILGGL